LYWLWSCLQNVYPLFATDQMDHVSDTFDPSHRFVLEKKSYWQRDDEPLCRLSLQALVYICLSCPGPRELMASPKLLFLIPSSGAMTPWPKPSFSSIWRRCCAEVCSSRWKKKSVSIWSSKVIFKDLCPRDSNWGHVKHGPSEWANIMAYLLCFDDRACGTFRNLLNSLKIAEYRRRPWLERQAKKRVKPLMFLFLFNGLRGIFQLEITDFDPNY